jgi:hypothetical protein
VIRNYPTSTKTKIFSEKRNNDICKNNKRETHQKNMDGPLLEVVKFIYGKSLYDAFLDILHVPSFIK